MERDFVLVCALLLGAGVACMKDEGTEQIRPPPDASSGETADGAWDPSDPDGRSGDLAGDSDCNDGDDGHDLDAAEDGTWAADGGDAAVADADGPGDAPADGPEVGDLALEESPSDLLNGQRCQSSGWCRSRFCVDGVCCEGACEQDEPMRCRACAMARTGQRDGVCATDRGRERAPCGTACGQVATNVPSVLEMICVQGRCLVPDAPRTVDTCRKELDRCITSFCDQATTRSARCVHSPCPQASTCCCENPADASARSCVPTNACTAGRACVSQ